MTPAIDAYFRAKNLHDTQAMADSFAADAVVHDDGETILGIAAIRKWIVKTTEAYRVQVEVQEVIEQPDEIVVHTLVSGNFDGSPFPFEYRFKIQNGKIGVLAIT
ncbi:MAG: nuclear transport factor 2 family protein [Fimbriimonas sp.]